MDWMYAGSNIVPQIACEVLCDLGKQSGYKVLKFVDGMFKDKSDKVYRLGDDIKRYMKLPKHYDEQF